MSATDQENSPHSEDLALRSVGELIAILLGGADEDFAWEVRSVLHSRGDAEVMERAWDLCRSACALERRVGAQILAQVGSPVRAYPAECIRLLLDMLERETDQDVVHAILIALSHHRDPRIVAAASRYRRHPNLEIRLGVVHAISGYEEPLALRNLIELTTDRDPLVRDWATFGLGSLVETDTPAIREALHRRLSDEDVVTRGEALVGLANRGDRRVVPVLKVELGSSDVDILAVEAAEAIADPELYELLLNLEGSSTVSASSLADAILACSPRRADRM